MRVKEQERERESDRESERDKEIRQIDTERERGLVPGLLLMKPIAI